MTFVSAAEEDHSDSDCFVAAILTHGSKVRRTRTPEPSNKKEAEEVEKEADMVEVLLGNDSSEITIENLSAPLKDCKSLVGKPKIFIIQVFTFQC